jgi:hypothetical protein
MNMKLLAAVLVVMAGTALVMAQTDRPTTRPSEPANPDMMLRQLLSPARPSAKPLESVEYEPQQDATSRTGIAPKTEPQNLVREGSFVIDRVGRLTRAADGHLEFTFEADGTALKDPPMIIHPNLKLRDMETAVKTNSRDLKFVVTGMVTEYNGRNYILLEKVQVVQESPSGPDRSRLDERERR